jgi:undecaprenyl pyrophosphate phosphatase UppP
MGYFISFITIVVIFFLAIFMHISTVTSSYVRIGRIEGFYNSFIVAPAEIEELKKKTNRRNMIIFCICSLIVGLIVYSAYKSFRNKKNK